MEEDEPELYFNSVMSFLPEPVVVSGIWTERRVKLVLRNSFAFGGVYDLFPDVSSRWSQNAKSKEEQWMWHKRSVDLITGLLYLIIQ